MSNTPVKITSSRGRARIGIVLPMANTNLEPDMMMLCPKGVSLHFMRAGGYDLDKIPDSAQMRQFALSSLDEVINTLNAARPDVILYGCTSATLSLGPSFDKKFADDIAYKSGAKAVTAAGAIVEALEFLGIKKIAFSSPYVEQLNKESIDFLNQCEIQVVSSAYVGSDLDNYAQGELTPQSIYELGMNADSNEAEALVLSCTDMRSVEAVDALERALGKPVITSNQALMWAAVKRLGIEDDRIITCGRLLCARQSHYQGK